MPYLQKFSEKSFRAPSSRNRTEEGVGSKEEDAPECRWFWDKVDLRLGAIKQTNRRKREREREREIKREIERDRERETIRKVPTTAIYKKIKK